MQHFGLQHGCCFRQRDQNNFGVVGVLQAHERGDHARGAMAFQLAHHLAVVGARGVHQQHGVPGGRRVQHHVSTARLSHHARKRMEHGHFFGAGRLQVFQHQSPLLRVQPRPLGRHDFVHIALGLHQRVNAVDPQAVHHALQRTGQVGRRVGGAQVHGFAALHQAQGQRGGDRGLANAAFAHDHDQAAPGAGQFIGQCTQTHRVRHHTRCRCRTAGDGLRVGIEQGTQGRQSDGIKRPQWHLVLGQCAQVIRHGRQGLGAQCFKRLGHRVGLVGRMKHAVDHQALVIQAQRFQLVRCAGRLGNGAFVGARDQDNGGQRRVGQGVECRLETNLLHLQTRMRPEAGGALVIAGQKAAPGFGQTQQPQGVPGGCRVKNEVVVGLVFIGQQGRELIERCNLGGAGARQLLAHR